MEISIDKVAISDAAGIARLSEQLGYAATTIQIQKRLHLLHGHPEHGVFGAYLNGKIIGWVHAFFALRVESDSFVEIAGLVVEEQYRGKGVGGRLVEAVAQWALPFNCPLRVRCNEKRTASHQFYLKAGFEERKTQKVFVRSIIE